MFSDSWDTVVSTKGKRRCLRLLFLCKTTGKAREGIGGGIEGPY